MQIPPQCVPLLVILGAMFVAFALGEWWTETLIRRSNQGGRKGGAK